MSRLWKSSKFWMAMLDLVVSLGAVWAAYLIGDPELLDVVVKTIGFLQIAFAAVIGGIAWEDYGVKRDQPNK